MPIGIYKRKPQTAEHIRNKVEARKGYKHSKETLEKIRQSNIGKKRSEETKNKIRLVHLGKKDGKRSEETKKKMSVALKGKKKSIVHCQNISKAKKIKPNRYWLGKKRLSMSGDKNWRWIKDRTAVLERHRIRGSLEWKEWRSKVFERDKYTCQECGASGVYIEPHHIVPIRSDRENLFNTKNGITLCRPCHQKTVWKESDYQKKYLAIVAAQM